MSEEHGGYGRPDSVLAYERGREHGASGMLWCDAGTKREAPCRRRAYRSGFALGYTEGVIERGRRAQGQ